MTQEEINCLLQRPKDDAARAIAEAEAETYSQRLDYVKAKAYAEAKTEACEEEFYGRVKGIAEALESAILKFEKNR